MRAMDALDRAIEIAGSATALAEQLGLKWPSVVTNWKARGQVPPERCADIERVTAGKVTRAELRPDLFGDPSDTKAAA